MFGSSHHSLAVVAPVKYEWQSKNLMDTLVRLKILPAEENK